MDNTHREYCKHIVKASTCFKCGKNWNEMQEEVKERLMWEIEFFTEAPGFSWNSNKLAEYLMGLFIIENK